MNTIMRSSRKPIIPRNPDKNEIGGENQLLKNRKTILHSKYQITDKKSQFSTFWNNVNRAEDIEYT